MEPDDDGCGIQPDLPLYTCPRETFTFYQFLHVFLLIFLGFFLCNLGRYEQSAHDDSTLQPCEMQILSLSQAVSRTSPNHVPYMTALNLVEELGDNSTAALID